MKIVITGATGFVGNALGTRLTRDGHEVFALVRDVNAAREVLSFPARLSTYEDAAKALESADALIHLAGENIATKRWSEARKRDLKNSRIETAHALRDATSHKIKTVIAASAIGIYGDRGDEVLDEASTSGRGFLSELCQTWEAASQEIPAERFCAIRIGVVLGEGGGFLNEVVPLFKRFGASRLGNGQQYFSWIHIDDLVEVFLRVLSDEKLKGPFNAVTDHPLTNAEMTRTLAARVHAHRAPPAPTFALKTMFGELSAAVLGSARVEPRRLLEVGFKFKHPTFDHALAHIFEGFKAGEMQSAFAQWVPGTPDDVWRFFSDENNLEQITPPLLNFKVLNKSTKQLEAGTLIDYRLKVHGVPVRWRTLIGAWEPPRRFTDEQVRGPYARWHHEHRFEPLQKGVRITDRVRWQLPFGILGRAVALPFVLNDVNSIFRYRAKTIAKVFYPG